ncbi:hypothetical protein [Cellulomonas sp. NS3]|uniref:hypothetical protein n=1 Tax=Cellulomonas sp. NS3 TaxID=2973977 RepID=UPI0021626A95|nr:hypothetical protein [Cellulomonas sp. NS3]
MSDGRLLDPTLPTEERAAAAHEPPEVKAARAAHVAAIRAHERATSQLEDAVDDTEHGLSAAIAAVRASKPAGAPGSTCATKAPPAPPCGSRTTSTR